MFHEHKQIYNPGSEQTQASLDQSPENLQNKCKDLLPIILSAYEQLSIVDYFKINSSHNLFLSAWIDGF